MRIVVMWGPRPSNCSIAFTRNNSKENKELQSLKR